MKNQNGISNKYMMFEDSPIEDIVEVDEMDGGVEVKVKRSKVSPQEIKAELQVHQSKMKAQPV